MRVDLYNKFTLRQMCRPNVILNVLMVGRERAEYAQCISTLCYMKLLNLPVWLCEVIKDDDKVFFAIFRNYVVSYTIGNYCTRFVLSHTLIHYIFDAWKIWIRCVFSFSEKEICGCNMYKPNTRGMTFCYIAIIIRQSMNVLRCKNHIWLLYVMMNIMI